MEFFTGNGVKLSCATKPQHFKINTVPSKTFVSVLLWEYVIVTCGMSHVTKTTVLGING